MRTRIKRWLLMLEKGLNIPDYVENPCRKNKNNTVSFLKEVFHGYPFVMVLSEKAASEIIHDRTTIGNAITIAAFLEDEEQDYRVWVAEGVDCEYTGSVWVYQDGSGKLRYAGIKSAKYNFSNVETIRDLKDRIIVRRVHEFVKSTEFGGVQMDFGWAKHFIGKTNERIVFFDFSPLEKSS